MADTVLKKSNAAEKEAEMRALQYAMERDKRAEAEDNRRKKHVMDRNIEIKQTLDRQMQEKKQLKEHELIKNKEYVAQIIAKDDNDKANDKEQEKKNLQKMKEIQKF